MLTQTYIDKVKRLEQQTGPLECDMTRSPALPRLAPLEVEQSYRRKQIVPRDFYESRFYVTR